MLVLSMNSKRQRRPNVRLGEVGAVSAAFACGFSQKSKESLEHKRWKSDFDLKENQYTKIIGFSENKSSDFLISDPGASMRLSADLQQNRENKNPNSPKSGFDFVSGDEIDMVKSSLNFGTITRKSRVMRRRGRSADGSICGIGGAWTRSYKLSPQFNGDKEFTGVQSNASADYNLVSGFQDISDHETTGTSKDACEFGVDESGFDSWQQLNADGCYQGNNALLKSGEEWDQVRYTYNDVTSVRRWLEDLGFGRYAGIFEMHEVDEETLPQLTLDDLKEMGVFAVGHRRKLYTAIQQLRAGDVSS